MLARCWPRGLSSYGLGLARGYRLQMSVPRYLRETESETRALLVFYSRVPHTRPRLGQRAGRGDGSRDLETWMPPASARTAQGVPPHSQGEM